VGTASLDSRGLSAGLAAGADLASVAAGAAGAAAAAALASGLGELLRSSTTANATCSKAPAYLPLPVRSERK
jgi:hypothetical protein